MQGYYQNVKFQQQRVLNNAFYEQTKSDQMARKANGTNFLNSHYRTMFPNVKNTGMGIRGGGGKGDYQNDNNNNGWGKGSNFR